MIYKIKEDQSIHSASGNNSDIRERRFYSTPVLQVYGSVAKLTQKVGGSADGGGTMMV